MIYDISVFEGTRMGDSGRAGTPTWRDAGEPRKAWGPNSPASEGASRRATHALYMS